MILTIGMIVKNEEKYLERCLTAIKPLLDAVDSELIITDTGSSDATVDIARRFTDKVIMYEWSSDFSAARNVCIEAARGEWFMFLDADDIFRSCDGIVEFFLSGEYRSYNSASYISHNLTIDPSRSVDYRAPRLTKLLPETRFLGVVHEVLSTYGYPIKNIGDTADHYGYIYHSEEERQNKYSRNRSLLALKLEKDGENADPVIYLQLFQTCMMGSDREKALSYLDTGIKKASELSSIALPAMYSTKAYLLYSEKAYEDALGVCGEYFAMDKAVRDGDSSLDIETLAVRAASFAALGKCSEAADSFEKFFEIWDRVRSGEINTPEIFSAQLYMATDSNYMGFVSAYLRCCLAAGTPERAVKTLAGLELTPYSSDKNGRGRRGGSLRGGGLRQRKGYHKVL